MPLTGCCYIRQVVIPMKQFSLSFMQCFTPPLSFCASPAAHSSQAVTSRVVSPGRYCPHSNARLPTHSADTPPARSPLPPQTSLRRLGQTSAAGLARQRRTRRLASGATLVAVQPAHAHNAGRDWCDRTPRPQPPPQLRTVHFYFYFYFSMDFPQAKTCWLWVQGTPHTTATLTLNISCYHMTCSLLCSTSCATMCLTLTTSQLSTSRSTTVIRTSSIFSEI